MRLHPYVEGKYEAGPFTLVVSAMALLLRVRISSCTTDGWAAALHGRAQILLQRSMPACGRVRTQAHPVLSNPVGSIPDTAPKP